MITEQVKFKIFMRSDEILEVILFDEALLDVDDINCMIIKITDFVEPGKKYPLLAIPGERVDVTREARTYSIRKRMTYALAEAMVIRSLPVRIAATFYYKFYAPLHPYKFFPNETEAVEWLNQMRKELGN